MQMRTAQMQLEKAANLQRELSGNDEDTALRNENKKQQVYIDPVRDATWAGS
jgi:hypothetical protein